MIADLQHLFEKMCGFDPYPRSMDMASDDDDCELLDLSCVDQDEYDYIDQNH